MTTIIKLLISLFVLSSSVAFAMDAGTAAQSMMAPTEFVTSFLEKCCGLVGVGFMMGGLLQYKMHRTTPTAVPLSRCIILMLLGLALLAIPFLGYYAHVANLEAIKN